MNCGMTLLIHSQTAPLKFGNGWAIWSHIYWACDYLSMLGLKLDHVSKRGPCVLLVTLLSCFDGPKCHRTLYHTWQQFFLQSLKVILQDVSHIFPIVISLTCGVSSTYTVDENHTIALWGSKGLYEQAGSCHGQSSLKVPAVLTPVLLHSICTGQWYLCHLHVLWS